MFVVSCLVSGSLFKILNSGDCKGKLNTQICLVFYFSRSRLGFYFTRSFAIKFIFTICKKGDKP